MCPVCNRSAVKRQQETGAEMMILPQCLSVGHVLSSPQDPVKLDLLPPVQPVLITSVSDNLFFPNLPSSVSLKTS